MLNNISIYLSILAAICALLSILLGYGYPVTPQGELPVPGQTNIAYNRYIALVCLGASCIAFLSGLIGIFVNEKKQHGVAGIILSILSVLYLLIKASAR